jgi:hypothetical protein
MRDSLSWEGLTIPGTEPDLDPVPVVEAGPVRRSLLRGALCALAGAGTVALAYPAVRAWSGSSADPSELLTFVLIGAGFGILPAATLLVERLVKRREPSLERDLAGTLLVGLTAYVAAFLVVVQSFYVRGLIETRDPAKAYLELSWMLEKMRSNAVIYTVSFGVMASPLLVLTFARLRNMALGRQMLVTLGGTSVLVVPAILALFASNPGASDARAFMVLGASVLGIAALLPLLSVLADRLEDRVARWLEWERG